MRDIKKIISNQQLNAMLSGREAKKLRPMMEVLWETPREALLDQYSIIGGQLAQLIGQKQQAEDLHLQEEAAAKYQGLRDKLTDTLQAAIAELDPKTVDTARDKAEEMVKKFEAFWSEEMAKVTGQGRGK